mgnify:CR=1 FL=1
MDIQELERNLDKLKEEVALLKQSRVSQTGVIPGAIKSRHIGEGPRFIRSGLATDLPTEGENATDSSALYYATDTNVLYLWDGSAWKSITVSDYSAPTKADSDYPNLSKLINRQDNTTDSVVSNQLIQFGWGWKLGDGANRLMSESVTFPVAYDVAPIVLISSIGGKSGSDPSAITDSAITTTGVYNATCGDITTTTFSAVISRVSVDGNDPGVLSNTFRYCYSWIAIGTKAR